MLTTLSSYYVEAAREILPLNKTLVSISGKERSANDLLNQATQLLNEVERIAKNDRLSFVLKGIFLVSLPALRI
jgi:hypothetical protein